MKRILFLISFICLVINVGGKEKSLTLEDIYSNGVYTPKVIKSMRWITGTDCYTVLENSKIYSAKDLVQYDVKNGERKILVSATELVPEDSEKPLIISDYQWNENQSKLLIFTNTSRVWRYNTKGDYWVFDLKNKKLQKIGKTNEPSETKFAKFSHDSKKVAYVYLNNIYVETLETSKVEQLTFDGNTRIINGTFDWVYEEELGCRDGFRWSSDDSRIIYWHSDTKGTGKFTLIDNIDSLYSKVKVVPYPKVGTMNSAVKLGVVELSNKTTEWFKIPGDSRNNYLARMEVIPNTNQVMIQQLNRLQNTNKVYIANVDNMSINNIYTDKDKAFLDIHDNVKWLDNNKYFTWTSEKDGWLHLYKISKDGKEEQLITKGDFDVISISCINPKTGYVYYIASPYNATERYLYRSKLNGRGEAERVTPLNKVGHNSYQVSPDSRWAIYTYQNTITPPIYSIVSLPEHKIVKILEDNHDLMKKVSSLDLNPKEFFKVDIGEGVVLDGWMIKPKKFNPNKKYPVIVWVYGEPAGTTVQNNWGGYHAFYDQYMAQQGYIVMSIDPRGTKTPRGREWRKCIYEKIGIVAPADHAKAMQVLEDQYSFIDKDRIGIWGWSGGGQMTLNAMFKYPEIYSTGIAVAFVCDQHLYDTIYQERYMGLPSDNKKGYFEGSPINFANNLQGDLMIIAGTADDNVHYQSFEKLTDRLIKYKKIFSMMSYPMRSHGIYERENTTYHLYKTMTMFWLSHLKPNGVTK